MTVFFIMNQTIFCLIFWQGKQFIFDYELSKILFSSKSKWKLLIIKRKVPPNVFSILFGSKSKKKTVFKSKKKSFIRIHWVQKICLLLNTVNSSVLRRREGPNPLGPKIRSICVTIFEWQFILPNAIFFSYITRQSRREIFAIEYHRLILFGVVGDILFSIYLPSPAQPWRFFTVLFHVTDFIWCCGGYFIFDLFAQSGATLTFFDSVSVTDFIWCRKDILFWV